MLIIGFLALCRSFLAERATTSVAITVPSVVVLLLLWLRPTDGDDSDDSEATPIKLPEWGILTIKPFFRTRFDFLSSSFELCGKSIFQFNLLRNTVIAVSGEVGRKDFFTSKGLDINEGFAFLSGAIPMLPGVTSDLQARRISMIHKRLSTAQNSDHLSRLLPRILADSTGIMRTWGNSGTLDLFDSVPKLFFQTTVRALAATEIADDAALVARLKELYDRLDETTTPTCVLLPWFPSPSMLGKLLASKRIYDIVNHAIELRIQSGRHGDDTLQILLDSGDDRMVVLGFIMGLLVAGARSTGTTASWLLAFLESHPEWKYKAIAEVEQLVSDHSSLPLSNSHETQLSAVPIEAWEGNMPVFDAMIRETLRVAQPHTAMRRNIGPDTYINGARIPSGAYVVYPFSDVHLNSALYPDPWRWDPARSESKMPFSYVGWGGGKTVCLGQRLAKLELKTVISLYLLEFKSDLVDGSGRRPDSLPRPNWNDALTCKPPSGSYMVEYSRRKTDFSL
ncbi:hypothetical protein QCA50_018673 [Cerrena zonata]|uniref:Cytochrome P450 n=1 Tax=Cerrena zonata TaxID=2478898 RepID=A0AAW0FNS2_9APHY